MAWYIWYPKKKNEKVLIVKSRPSYGQTKNLGFAEGPFKNLVSVNRRLNQMNVPESRRTQRGR